MTALALAGLLACAGAPKTVSPAPGASPAAGGPRLLFFAFDGIPYELVAELTDPARGEATLFADFSRPVPLISSFPSTSSLAFTGLLEPFELPKPPGYEARFFDRGRNRVRGGGPFSYHKIPFGWREFFTWRYNNAIRRSLATARPVRSSVREVEWALEAFAASDEPRFFAYVALTDGAGHLEGPESLVPALTALDRGLARLRRERPELDFYTVVYSDHGLTGGEPLDNVRPRVEAVLRRAGFDLSRHLRRPDDAVIVPFGLVSSFEVYTLPGQEERVLAALSGTHGVDLCVAPAGPPATGPWRVADESGEAQIARRRGEEDVEWSYRPGSGDPLGYRQVVEGLRRRAGEPGAVFFPDAWWLEETRDHLYPDALHRLARTFDLVVNAASAVCSLAPGHMYGARATELAARLSVGRLRWTHGALSREASLGFLMTDLPGWRLPPAARFDRALAPFAELDGEELRPASHKSIQSGAEGVTGGS